LEISWWILCNNASVKENGSLKKVVGLILGSENFGGIDS